MQLGQLENDNFLMQKQRTVLKILLAFVAHTIYRCNVYLMFRK